MYIKIIHIENKEKYLDYSSFTLVLFCVLTIINTPQFLQQLELQ